MSEQMAFTALTEEQLERIAKNKVLALERKRVRELEETTGGPADKMQKRLSSAPTPPRDEWCREQGGGNCDKQRARPAHASPPSNAVQRAMAELQRSQARHNQHQQYQGQQFQKQRPSAEDWIAASSSLHDEAQQRFEHVKEEGSGRSRPITETWMEEGVGNQGDGWGNAQQPSALGGVGSSGVKQQSFLSFGGSAISSGQALGFGQKPASQAHQMFQPKRSDNVAKHLQVGLLHRVLLPAFMLSLAPTPLRIFRHFDVVLLLQKRTAPGNWARDDDEQGISLTEEQMLVKKRVMNGENVFLTGDSLSSAYMRAVSGFCALSVILPSPFAHFPHVLTLSSLALSLACVAHFTGGAGTGKSFLVKNIIKSLQARASKSVAICASTGAMNDI